jgi:hypothetical protein
LAIDATYTSIVPLPSEDSKEENFLDRPPLEWGVDIKQYREEISKRAGTDAIRYAVIKCLMEIDRIIKVPSPL